jgi:hypothetical protein
MFGWCATLRLHSLSPVLRGESWGEGQYGSVKAEQFEIFNLIFNFNFSILYAAAPDENH